MASCLGANVTNKIPVSETVLASYRFAFDNYLKLLGVTWAPITMVFALMLWQLVPFMGDVNGLAAHNPSAAMGALGHVFIFEILSVVFLVIMTLGITMLALGLRPRWPFLYLSFGSDFWRLLLGYFLFFVILIVATLLISLVLGGIVGAIMFSVGRGNVGQLSAGSAGYRGAVICLIYATMALLFLRFAFLLPSVTISEKRIGLGRNWNLTHGNLWRLLVLLIALLVPLVVTGVLQMLFSRVVGGQALNYFDAVGSREASLAWSANTLRLYSVYWYLYIPFWILVAPIAYGVPICGAAIAYRQLSPGNPADAFA